MLAKLAEAKKAVAAAAGLLATLLAAGLIPEPYATYVSVALGVLTVLGVYQARNKAPMEDDAAPEIPDSAEF